MRQIVFTGTVALAMAAASAFAQTSSSQTATSGKTTPTASRAKAVHDQTFIKEAAAGGMAEVELGNLAEQKANSPEVKSFGKRMVDDHSKANDELKTLAQSKNVPLPTSLDATDQRLKDRLEKLSGPAFDRAYMQAMVRDHKKDVNEFRRESTSATDPDVKRFAAKTLPTLEDHLKLAQDTGRAVGTSGTTTAKKTTGK